MFNLFSLFKLGLCWFLKQLPAKMKGVLRVLLINFVEVVIDFVFVGKYILIGFEFRVDVN